MSDRMTSAVERTFLHDIGAETDRIATLEPEELRRLRTGTLENHAGSYGQYFGTWDIAHGMLRDFAFYSLYPLLRIARTEPTAPLASLCDELFEPYTNYLGYSGLPTLERFGLRLRAIARDADPAAIDRCLSAYLIYVNRLYAWAYHHFPWNLGENFRYPDAVRAGLAEDAPTAPPLAFDGPSIRLTWAELGVSVRAVLAASLNPELVEDFLAAVPFAVLQQHPMVTGESMFAWGAPIASTAPIRVREEIRLAPKGRLRFSQRTGQKIVVQYGPTTETIMSPVLGAVVAEDIDLLDAVGRAVWEGTYASKKLTFLRVERL